MLDICVGILETSERTSRAVLVYLGESSVFHETTSGDAYIYSPFIYDFFSDLVVSFSLELPLLVWSHEHTLVT